MKDRYVTCYVSGRCDAYEGELDTDAILEQITGGAPARDTSVAAARKAVMAEMDAATKVAWLKDNLDEVKEMGGDTEKAWKMFCEGRVDALAVQIDEAVMEALVNQIEDEEEEEELDEDSEDADDEDDDDSDDSEDEDDDLEDDE